MIKIRWEDIFNDDIRWHEQTKYMIIDTLLQAEAEGKCCLNPPDVFEIIKILQKVDYKKTDLERAEAIAKRIKEGK